MSCKTCIELNHRLAKLTGEHWELLAQYGIPMPIGPRKHMVFLEKEARATQRAIARHVADTHQPRLPNVR